MNVHRTLLRSEPATSEPYRFHIGQAVDHIGGKLRSVIVDRRITFMGREIYDLAVEPEFAAGRPFRTILGDALVAA